MLLTKLRILLKSAKLHCKLDTVVSRTVMITLRPSVVSDGEAASAAQSLRTSASKASNETCPNCRVGELHVVFVVAISA